MDYPIWNIAMGGGLLMALVAIPHVIVSHFAVGGGLVIVVTETLAIRRGNRELRELARRSSLVLILISTIFGAISGVGIWVVAGLVSPGAISALIHTYVWGWAMEWVFFILEIIAALVYVSTWDKISKSAHLLVGWLYFVGAYMSLVIINGIITFMLTPGRWLETLAFWDGFFNPTYWPSLVLRTGVVLLMAVAFMVIPAQRTSAAQRPRIMRYLGWWFVAGVALSYAGYRWWEAVLPETVRGLFLGSAPTLEALATTRHLTLWALAVALGAALIGLLVAPKVARVVTAGVLMVAAFTFFASYERLREGVRKPFLIHSHLFSNGLLVSDIDAINHRGLAAWSGWVGRRTEDHLDYGRSVFEVQCSICHTIDGYQGIRSKLPSVGDFHAVSSGSEGPAPETVYHIECAPCHRDTSYADMAENLPSPDEILADVEMIEDLNHSMIVATLGELRDMGSFYSARQTAGPLDTHQTRHPTMPPFVGTDDELEALGEYLSSLARDDARSRVLLGGE